jgi:hypothetical protein
MAMLFSLLCLLIGGAFIFASVTKQEAFFDMLRRSRRLFASFSEGSLPVFVLVLGIVFASIGLLTMIF